MRSGRGTREDGWGTITSLKERMAQAPDSADRPVSTSGAGAWLDGLRMSFEPGGDRRPNAPNVLESRQRSV